MIHRGIYIVEICLARLYRNFVFSLLREIEPWNDALLIREFTRDCIQRACTGVNIGFRYVVMRPTSPLSVHTRKTLCGRWYPIVEALGKCQSRRRRHHVRSQRVLRLPCPSARRDATRCNAMETAKFQKLNDKKRTELFRNYSFFDWNVASRDRNA